MMELNCVNFEDFCKFAANARVEYVGFFMDKNWVQPKPGETEGRLLWKFVLTAKKEGDKTVSMAWTSPEEFAMLPINVDETERAKVMQEVEQHIQTGRNDLIAKLQANFSKLPAGYSGPLFFEGVVR